jgi:hypothetical protein
MFCTLCLGRLPVHVLRPGGVHHEQWDDDPQPGGPGAVAQRLPTQRLRQGGEGRFLTYVHNIKAMLTFFCLQLMILIASIAICAPTIYTALCVMLLMRAASITRASGRGLGPGNIETFLGPVKWRRANRRVPFVAQENQTHYHRAV